MIQSPNWRRIDSLWQGCSRLAHDLAARLTTPPATSRRPTTRCVYLDENKTKKKAKKRCLRKITQKESTIKIHEKIFSFSIIKVLLYIYIYPWLKEESVDSRGSISTSFLFATSSHALTSADPWAFFPLPPSPQNLTPYEFVEGMKKRGIRVPGIGHRYRHHHHPPPVNSCHLWKQTPQPASSPRTIAYHILSPACKFLPFMETDSTFRPMFKYDIYKYIFVLVLLIADDEVKMMGCGGGGEG